VIQALILFAVVAAPKVTTPTPYVPMSCASLQESLPHATSPSQFYGELMGEALRRHGFDTAYPHIDRQSLAKSEMDWAMCFAAAPMPTSVPAKKK
jgi:hypothetical protein